MGGIWVVVSNMVTIAITTPVNVSFFVFARFIFEFYVGLSNFPGKNKRHDHETTRGIFSTIRRIKTMK